MTDTRRERRDWQCGTWLTMVTMFAVIALVLPVRAETWQSPLGAAASPDGAELFTTYCASCHGTDGMGNGPLARTLRHAPTDLTGIASKNGGMFPSTRVRRIVEGRDVEAHGDRDMPVWGDAFKTTREGRSRETADSRIAAIVVYLESIQRRVAH